MLKKLSQIAVAILVVGVGTACNEQPAPTSPLTSEPLMNISGSRGNVTAIEEIVNTFDQAWTAGDPVAYAAQYAAAEWVGPTGLVLRNAAAITGLYTNILRRFAGSTRTSTIRGLTFLTGTIAVLDIDARVTGFPVPAPVTPWQPGVIRALERNILIKRGGEWQIVMHQQVTVAPGVP